MVVSVRSCLVFLCLQVRLTGTFLPSFAASIADLNIEEEDARDKPEDLSEKEFFDKNRVLLAENTVVISYLTEDSPPA